MPGPLPIREAGSRDELSPKIPSRRFLHSARQTKYVGFLGKPLMGHTIAAVRGAEGLLLNGRETRTALDRTDPEHIRATADAAAAVKAPLDIEVPASGTGVIPISTRANFSPPSSRRHTP